MGGELWVGLSEMGSRGKGLEHGPTHFRGSDGFRRRVGKLPPGGNGFTPLAKDGVGVNPKGSHLPAPASLLPPLQALTFPTLGGVDVRVIPSTILGLQVGGRDPALLLRGAHKPPACRGDKREGSHKSPAGWQRQGGGQGEEGRSSVEDAGPDSLGTWWAPGPHPALRHLQLAKEEETSTPPEERAKQTVIRTDTNVLLKI